MDNRDDLGRLAYFVLFGDTPDQDVNPADPANFPRIKAERKKKVKDLKKFWEGPGSPLMDRWKQKIRMNVNDLFTSPDPNCTCETCSKIRNITSILRVLAEAEAVLNK